MTFTRKLDPHRNPEGLAHDCTGSLASDVTSVKLEKTSHFYRKISVIVMLIKGGRSRRKKLTLATAGYSAVTLEHEGLYKKL